MKIQILLLYEVYLIKICFVIISTCNKQCVHTCVVDYFYSTMITGYIEIKNMATVVTNLHKHRWLIVAICNKQ